MKDTEIILTVAGIGVAGAITWYLWEQYRPLQANEGIVDFGIITAPDTVQAPDITWRCGFTFGQSSIEFYIDDVEYCIGSPVEVGTHVFSVVITNTQYGTMTLSANIEVSYGETTWLLVSPTGPTITATYTPPTTVIRGPIPTS